MVDTQLCKLRDTLGSFVFFTSMLHLCYGVREQSIRCSTTLSRNIDTVWNLIFSSDGDYISGQGFGCEQTD